MFVHGFNKTAGVASMLGTGVGKAYAGAGAAVGAVKKLKANIGSGLNKAKQIRTNAIHVQTGSGSKNVGEGLAKRRAAKLSKADAAKVDMKSTQAVAANDVAARRERMRKAEPSWAAKNPIKTAVGAFVAGRYALGGSSPSQPQQQPQLQQAY